MMSKKSQQQNITKQEPEDEAMRSTGAVEAVQVEVEGKEENEQLDASPASSQAVHDPYLQPQAS